MSWTLKEKCRERLARESGYRKRAWGGRLAVCLAYPNTYRAGMSNLGFQTIYALLNRDEHVVCERVFLPDPGDEQMFEPGQAPLFSLESQKSLTEFHIVAFSVSFENDYPNILKMLALAGIPLSAEERGERHPLIAGGGISVTLNPEPLCDFFDLFLLGEAEESLPEWMRRYKLMIRSGLSRKEVLFALQQGLEGVYVPALYRVLYHEDQRIRSREAVDAALPVRMKKRWVKDINAFLTEQEIAAADTELGTMHLTEVSRGCQRGCRFCAAGFVYRPARFRSEPVLQASILRGLTAQKKIGLVGTAVSDHPDLKRICRQILGQAGKIAIGSLRLDRLDTETLTLLKEGGIETVSLAPEAGSQRLRDVIRKGFGERQILDAVAALVDHGILNIRLYFMVGLPTETDADIDALIRLVEAIKMQILGVGTGKKPFRRLTVSVNQFIPKAATPFQWRPLEPIRRVQKKIRLIEKAFRRDPAVHVIHDIPKWNYVQALLSLGDRRVGKILLRVHREGGNWPHALKTAAPHPDFYVYRQKDPTEILPWDFIDHGVSREFLLKEAQDAFDA
ncbi:MAG: radical SAM protein [Syntrophus sp. (in: bacteria)]|nr:radical SAM protein [Syntrophus sp. (in: bacteria)]